MLGVLAISSGGGHWEQLQLVAPSFQEAPAAYATTIEGLAEKYGIKNGYLVPDCNRNRPVDSVRCFLQVFRLVRQLRPAVVISTGAAPGLFGLLAGKVFGAKTIWIDSIANSEKVSMSGRLAGWFADVWLTQWSHLETQSGPRYWGSVL